MKDLSREIYAYALKNALEFEAADAGKILPKLFQYGLEKKDIGRVMPQIQTIVDEVNALDEQQRQQMFETYASAIKERIEKEKKLPDLINVKGKVVTRLPPEPSKFLHLGHALSFLINAMYAEKYKGSCLLRFEDANPQKVEQKYVDAILEDITDYLQIKIGGVRYVSDDITQLYTYADQLVDAGHAYMCFCDREQMQTLRHEGTVCECRSRKLDDHRAHWQAFKAGKYAEGAAVLRLAGEMQHVNHMMRDPVLFRIITKKHFRTGTKYRAWPMYDFYNPLEDSMMGITHILRSNEFDMRIELHEHLKKLLKLPTQTVVQYGRFNVIGAETKGRDIRDHIEAGDFSGWDDPRLMTLRALRRRGIKREVLMELVHHLGLSQKQVHIDFNMIAAISRKLLDADTPRYYFVPQPVTFSLPEVSREIKAVEAKVHPAKDDVRILNIGKTLSISQTDYDALEGQEVRLMNLCTLRLEKKPEFVTLENTPAPKIQWVSKGVKTKVRMDTGAWVSGIAEENIRSLNVGAMVQFERFGFCRLDRVKNKTHEFWFTHR